MVVCNILFVSNHFCILRIVFIFVVGISQENPNAVVIGLAPDLFNYASMNKAFRSVCYPNEICYVSDLLGRAKITNSQIN